MSLNKADEECSYEASMDDLQRDASWKRIQQNTFTRWVNKHLKCVDTSIENLESEFEDGLKLIKLIEVLSGKQFKRFNRRVSFYSHKLENVTLALDFLQKVEKIKIVNIDSSAIVDRNLKLILGLVWTLILHYSISKQISDEVSAQNSDIERTPKQKLITWIKNKLPPGLPVNNFTSDWNDGVLLGALVKSFTPDLDIDWQKWVPAEALHSTRKAMQIANDYLNIVPLITPEELISPAVDAKSVMTYLSQFPQAQYRPALGRIVVFDSSPVVSKPSKFIISTTNPSISPEITIIDPLNAAIELFIDKATSKDYDVLYYPQEVGEHKVLVTLRDNCTGATNNLSPMKATAIKEANVSYDDRCHVDAVSTINVHDINGTDIKMMVSDCAGDETILPVTFTQSSCQSEFIPHQAGPHSISVLENGKHISGSPFPMVATRKALFNVWGRGICQEGARVGDDLIIHVDATEVSVAPLSICVYSSNGMPLSVNHSVDATNLHQQFEYKPNVEGAHKVVIKVGEQYVGSSPYEINVKGVSKSTITAFGPGLEGGIATLPAIFFVQTNHEHDQLSFHLEGPSEPELFIVENGDGSLTVHHTPDKEGIYIMDIHSNGEHIKGSPFVFEVDQMENRYRSLLEAHINGIYPSKSLVKGELVKFTIDTFMYQEADLEPVVKVLNSKCEQVPIETTKCGKNSHSYSFTPETSGRHYISASLGNIAIDNTPFMVRVIDTEAIKVYGPGLGFDVRCQEPTHFFIDAKGAGSGEIEVSLCDREGPAADVDVLDNKDGSFTVKYTAPRPGSYQLNIVFAGVEIPKIEINVKPQRVTLPGIRVEGLENENVRIGKTKCIEIDTREFNGETRGLKVLAEDANGNEQVLKLISTSRSFIYKVIWEAQETGVTKIHALYYDNIFWEYEVVVNEKLNASKCRAYGEGLSRAYVGEVSKFCVDTQDAGDSTFAFIIKGPSESKTSLVDHSNGPCTLEYQPLNPGIYEISITFGPDNDPIPGSPFYAVVDYRCDSSKIVISKFSERIKANKLTSFTVDASQTAASPIIAHLNMGQDQPVVRQISPRVYQVEFTPKGKADDEIALEVFYGDELLNNKPIKFILDDGIDVNQLVLRGDSNAKVPSEIACSVPTCFVLDLTDVGNYEKLVPEIRGPNGKLRKSLLKATCDPDIYLLEFVPNIRGEYSLVFFVNDYASKRYTIFAEVTGDANKCKIIDAPKSQYWLIEQAKEIVIDVSDAGRGFLSILCQKENEVKLNYKTSEDGYQIISLTPLTMVYHEVEVLFGGVRIPNGFFTFECVEDVPDLEELSLEKTKEFEESELHINTSTEDTPVCIIDIVVLDYIDLNPERLSAVVKMPSGAKDNATINDNKDGTLTLSYKPSIAGHHQLAIQQDGVNIVGCPMSFYVDDFHQHHVTIYGQGLSRAVVLEPATFTVYAQSSVAQELSVAVEGPGKANVKCHDNKDSTCSITWVPPAPGEYKIQVKLGGKSVTGSPFLALVAGEGLKRAHLSIGSTSEISLNIAMQELKGLSASIKSPFGIEEPCFVRLIDKSNIGVSFTPREVGDHLITVKKDGKVLPKSPFRVKVDKCQVGDASKVIVSGDGKAQAICQKFNDITVDTRNAGFGGLSVSVEGPSKAELKCKEAKNSIVQISYLPTEPGIYILSLKFADLHVKDSPFTINCIGKGVGLVGHQIKKSIMKTLIALADQDSFLFFQLSNTSPMDLTAKIMSPDSKSEDIEMRDLGGNFYQIKFRNYKEGTHAISVFHKNQHIIGSPFQYTVGHYEDYGAHRVRMVGIGTLRGETNIKQSFNLYIREAGEGQLIVAAEGPSKPQMEFKDHKDGSCHVEYVVGKPGEYSFSILFNDEHIPESPFKVFIAPATGEARRLELASFPQIGTPGKACSFTVLTHRAAGHLEAKVQNPSNGIETIDIVPVDEGESYALRFIPHESGNYYVDITLDGAPMRDSPFRIRIGEKDDSDPTAIAVSGDGIKGGNTGQKCEVIVNTLNAGPGILEVKVDGPSKVTLGAYELEQGYKVRYMALAPGAYYASIKYSGVHIPGSPFKINIEGDELGGTGEHETSLVRVEALAKTSKGTAVQAPIFKGDASKVDVKGAGLNKFFPGRAVSFNIDARMAGNDLLFIAVITTKGPCDDLTVKHQGEGQYIVTYRINERVKGFIFIKYGDINIPGSPFAIAF